MAAIARGGEETHRDALALVDELLHNDPAGAAGAGEPVEVAPRRGERPIRTPGGAPTRRSGLRERVSPRRARKSQAGGETRHPSI